eukprot:TRINITY_DN894_c0_g1_i1.p1 TRINITY_DN894_c0_g1~~TRINITY_DN894_c0_g1_i1.p1  ORF type:complete len:117 (-),score=44.98 TRINITY_DN894_c0_g1_i1:408-758(-)
MAADLIESLPKPLGKILQAGGWVWIGYAAVSLAKSFTPKSEADKASDLFAKLDSNKDGSLTVAEFDAECEKIASLKALNNNGFFDSLKNKAGSEGINKENFVAAWVQKKKDAAAFA